MFYLLNSRFIFAPVTTIDGLTGNRYVLVAILACLLLQLGYVYLPPLQAVFGSAALDSSEWMKVAGAGLLVFLVAELEKLVIRRTGLVGRLSVAAPATQPS
jgi:magnesium-transporting ATPase (P-type)